MSVSELPGLALPDPQIQPSQGEFTPLSDFSSVIPVYLRSPEPESLLLETRGVTSQKRQLHLFDPRLVHKATIAAKLRSIGCTDIAEPLEKCHTVQGFAQCTSCKTVKPFWNRCEHFFCPQCQPLLAADRAESIEWWTKQVTQPKHLVLTVRNTHKFCWKYVRWFKSCLTKLRRRAVCKNWRGGLWSLEVTNEGKGWHLHAHILVDVPYIDMESVSKAWASLVGQDFAICKVRDARKQDYLREVCKYAVKGSQLASWSASDIATFVYAMSGNRAFGVFGSLYGKRTQWAEWLKSILKQKKLCDCGCDQFEVFSEADWLIHQRREAILSGRLNLPPPGKLQPAFNLQSV